MGLVDYVLASLFYLKGQAALEGDGDALKPGEIVDDGTACLRPDLWLNPVWALGTLLVSCLSIL